MFTTPAASPIILDCPCVDDGANYFFKRDIVPEELLVSSAIFFIPSFQPVTAKLIIRKILSSLSTRSQLSSPQTANGPGLATHIMAGAMGLGVYMYKMENRSPVCSIVALHSSIMRAFPLFWWTFCFLLIWIELKPRATDHRQLHFLLSNLQKACTSFTEKFLALFSNLPLSLDTSFVQCHAFGTGHFHAAGGIVNFWRKTSSTLMAKERGDSTNGISVMLRTDSASHFPGYRVDGLQRKLQESQMR